MCIRDSNYSLGIENPNDNGIIFYTIDGSDPHLSSVQTNETILIGENHRTRILIELEDSGLNQKWTQVNYDDSSWQLGETGIGFERTIGEYDEFIKFPILSMLGKNASCLMRLEFTISNQQVLNQISKLILNMKYDDGYAAFINGKFVAGKNNPQSLTWNSRATKSHPDSLAVEFEPVDISQSISDLKIGKNILAVQGMNTSRGGSDFLILPKLSFETRPSNGISANAKEYSSTISLSSSGIVKARILRNNIWSALNEATFIVGAPAKAGNLVISEIHYNPAGNSEKNEFIELINTSNQIIELTGVKFTEGIRYEFNHSESLKPEERIVITPENYEGQLDNGGERITLIDAQGEIIESFKYDDKEPWYESSDGDGPSLVRIDPKSIFDPNLNTSWRSSANDGGNPGTFDNTQFEGDELIKYAFNDFATQQIEIQNGYIIFNYQKNLLADDITVIPQKSNDLQKWYNVEAFEVISQIKLDKNTANISLKIDNRNENDSSSMKYFRLKLNIIN